MPAKKKRSGREGQCYQLAWRYVTDKQYAGDGDWLLVHGILNTALTPTYFHAWAEKGNLVWEPQEDKLHERAEWYKAVVMVKERYTAMEAIVLGLRTKNFGPWNWEDREAVGVKEIDQVAMFAEIAAMRG